MSTENSWFVPDTIEEALRATREAAEEWESVAHEFSDFLPLIVLILGVQALVGVMNLITQRRIMRTVDELNLRLGSNPPDETDEG